jgi:hypothetical protein
MRLICFFIAFILIGCDNNYEEYFVELWVFTYVENQEGTLSRPDGIEKDQLEIVEYSIEGKDTLLIAEINSLKRDWHFGDDGAANSFSVFADKTVFKYKGIAFDSFTIANREYARPGSFAKEQLIGFDLIIRDSLIEYRWPGEYDYAPLVLIDIFIPKAVFDK